MNFECFGAEQGGQGVQCHIESGTMIESAAAMAAMAKGTTIEMAAVMASGTMMETAVAMAAMARGATMSDCQLFDDGGDGKREHD